MAIFAPALRRTLQELRDDPEDRVVRKDVRSADWDGGTDLSGGPDTAATKGYFADYSTGAIQAETFFHKGVDLGTWQAWTLTYNDFTLGNGTVTARYSQIGKVVFARFRLVFGSTTTIDGTDPRFSMPATAASDYIFTDRLGVADLEDNATNQIEATTRIWDTDEFVITTVNTAGTYGVHTAISATVPFTWATGDTIAFTAIYEAA